MHMRQRLRLAALFVSALLLAACGAKQGKNAKIQANWSGLYDTVPTDATYAIGYTLGEDSEVPDVLQGAASTLFEGGFGAIMVALGQEDLLEEAEWVGFQRHSINWMITEVSDLPRALEHLTDHYEELSERYGETYSIEQDRAGQRVILHVVDQSNPEAPSYLEITGANDFLIVRAAASEEDAEAAVEDFQLLSKDWGDVGRYIDTENGAAQRARSAGQPLDAWAYVNTPELNRQLQNEEGGGAAAEWAAMLDIGVENPSEECAGLNARLEQLVPSFTMVKFADKDGKNHTDAWLQLSKEGVANGRMMMPGAPSLKGIIQDALLGVGISFNFSNFFETLHAQPAHAECGGLAGVAGLLSEAMHEFSKEIKFNARTVSGTGALVVEDVNLQGFIPTANIGAYIDSPNAEALFRRVVRAFNKYGSTTAVEDATSPTVEGALSGVPMKVRIEQGEDRLLVYARDLNETLISRLLTVAPHDDKNVPFELQLNGERVEQLKADVEAYVEDMQMDDPRIDSAVEVLADRAGGVHVHLRFEDNGLRLRIDQQ